MVIKMYEQILYYRILLKQKTTNHHKNNNIINILKFLYVLSYFFSYKLNAFDKLMLQNT